MGSGIGPNRSLRLQRQLRGWSQEDVAAGLHQIAARLGQAEPAVDANMVSRWERGVTGPSSRYMHLLSALFHVPIHVLRFDEGAAVAPADLGWQADEEVKRREFLRSLGLLGGSTLLGLDQFGSMVANPPRVDSQLLDDLLRLTRGYEGQWGRLAPTTLLSPVQQHLATLCGLLRQPLTPSLRNQALGVASETATLAGWLSELVGNLGDARSCYNLAQALAHESNDGPRLSLALGAASSLYSPAPTRGRNAGWPLARTYLDQALGLAGGSASPQLSSWLLARLAEEHAIAGDQDAADGYLDRAAAVLATAPSEDAGLLSCANERWPAGFRGTCALVGHRPRAAVALLEPLLTADLALASQRSAVTTDLASACAECGDLDRACQLLMEAVTIAARADLREMIHRVFGARQQLAPWAASPEVQQLDEHLRLVA